MGSKNSFGGNRIFVYRGKVNGTVLDCVITKHCYEYKYLRRHDQGGTCGKDIIEIFTKGRMAI